MRYLFILFIFCNLNCYGQQLVHRLILFGDAGQINSGQKQLIEKAVNLIAPGKTSVYFLGDNIYPDGMDLERAMEQENILHSQFQPFVQQATPVTFIAGNHDWDKSGKRGLQKLKAQEEFIESRNINTLKFIPKAGTANLATVDIDTVAKLLLYDSEYWLFPHHINPDSALSLDIRNKFLDNIRKEVELNNDKVILILSHHPMISFGEHGDNFTWKDHVFPLTRLWKNLYLPLPILGSIYPILRNNLLLTAEDLNHTTYKNLTTSILNTVKNNNVLFVAGHDHGLQFIQDKDITQLVIGSGSKTSHISRNKKQKFASKKQGFCTVEILSNNDLICTFYTYDNGSIKMSYTTKLNLN